MARISGEERAREGAVSASATAASTPQAAAPAGASLSTAASAFPAHVAVFMRQKQAAAARLQAAARQHTAWVAALQGQWAAPAHALLYAPAVLRRRLGQLLFAARAARRSRGDQGRGSATSASGLFSGIHASHMPLLEAGGGDGDGAAAVVAEALVTIGSAEDIEGAFEPDFDAGDGYALTLRPWPGTPEAAAAAATAQLAAAAACKKAGRGKRGMAAPAAAALRSVA